MAALHEGNRRGFFLQFMACCDIFGLPSWEAFECRADLCICYSIPRLLVLVQFGANQPLLFQRKLSDFNAFKAYEDLRLNVLAHFHLKRPSNDTPLNELNPIKSCRFQNQLCLIPPHAHLTECQNIFVFG